MTCGRSLGGTGTCYVKVSSHGRERASSRVSRRPTRSDTLNEKGTKGWVVETGHFLPTRDRHSLQSTDGQPAVDGRFRPRKKTGYLVLL